MAFFRAGGGTLRTLGDWTSTRNVAIDSDGFRVETSGFNATLGNAEGSGLTSVDSKGGHGLVDWRRA